jgi:hypothetical protein
MQTRHSFSPFKQQHSLSLLQSYQSISFSFHCTSPSACSELQYFPANPVFPSFQSTFSEYVILCLSALSSLLFILSFVQIYFVFAFCLPILCDLKKNTDIKLYWFHLRNVVCLTWNMIQTRGVWERGRWWDIFKTWARDAEGWGLN